MPKSLVPKTAPIKDKSNNPTFSAIHSLDSRTFVHAKLEMSSPGDLDEYEADLAADSIVGGGKVYRALSAGGSGGIALPREMESRLASTQGQGMPMPSGLRDMMENGFTRDFSQVRLHTDQTAFSMSNSICAKAFTHGNDIYFAQGQYAPSTKEGQHLIAHELAHVVQGNGKVSRSPNYDYQREIAEHFFSSSWTWTQFYRYLEIAHPNVIKKLDLEEEPTRWGGLLDADFKDYGLDFLIKTANSIINDYYHRLCDDPRYRELSDREKANQAYHFAIAEFTDLVKLSNGNKVFDTLKQILSIKQKNFSEYHPESQSFKKSQEILSKGFDQLVFDGEIFDNREDIQKDVYDFLSTSWPKEVLDEVGIKGPSDIENHIKDFSMQMSKVVDAYAAIEFHKAYPEDASKRWLNDQYNVYAESIRALTGYEEEYKKKGDKGKARVAAFFKQMIQNRKDTLYEFHVDTRALVSAETWTYIFFKTLEIGFSVILGAPSVAAQLEWLFGKTIIKEIAGAMPGILSDSISYYISLAASSDKEWDKWDVIEEQSTIILVNMLKLKVGPLFDVDKAKDIFKEAMADKELKKLAIQRLMQEIIGTEVVENGIEIVTDMEKKMLHGMVDNSAPNMDEVLNPISTPASIVLNILNEVLDVRGYEKERYMIDILKATVEHFFR